MHENKKTPQNTGRRAYNTEGYEQIFEILRNIVAQMAGNHDKLIDRRSASDAKAPQKATDASTAWISSST